VEAVEKVAEKLRKVKPGLVETLTGTMRGKERDALVVRPVFQRFLRNVGQDGETVYLICTSAGEVGVNKPDRRIFDHLVKQFDIEPEGTLFIDDSPANIAAAGGLGFRVLQFTDAEALRHELVELGLLSDAQPAATCS
jgi:beta-phosphoglucomutase-like phosphatase (HAD superfamily)